MPQKMTDHQMDRLAAVISLRLDAQPEQSAPKRLREFQSFADAVPAIIFTATPSGEPQWFNAAYYELTEHNPVVYHALAHPNFRAEGMAAWRAAVAEQAPYLRHARVVDENGCHHWVTARGTPVFDHAGVLIFWICSTAIVAQQPMSAAA
jgi:PAS domain-containing protein